MASSPTEYPLVWLDGQIVPRDRFSLDPADPLLIYGVGFFETTRVVHGTPLHWDRHLTRLLEAAALIRIKVDEQQLPDACEVGAFVARCQEHESLPKQDTEVTGEPSTKEMPSLALRASTDESPSELGEASTHEMPSLALRASKESSVEAKQTRVGISNPMRNDAVVRCCCGLTAEGKTRVWMTARPAPTPLSFIRLHPFYIRVSRFDPFARTKSFNYGTRWLATRAAQSHGFDDGLLMSTDFLLLEAGRANLVFRIRDASGASSLVTPKAEGGLLPGIARQLIIEQTAKVADQLQLPACDLVERHVGLQELPDVESAWWINSVHGIVPVTQIADQGMHESDSDALLRGRLQQFIMSG